MLGRMGLFSLSENKRQKILTAASEVAGAPQVDAVAAQRKFAMTPWAWVVIVAAMASVPADPAPPEGPPYEAHRRLADVFGAITKPRRTVSFGPGGYTNFVSSVWTSNPEEVIGTYPTARLLPDKGVVVGGETVVMVSKELARLRSWTAPEVSAPAPDAPPFRSSTLGQHGQPRPGSGHGNHG